MIRGCLRAALLAAAFCLAACSNADSVRPLPVATATPTTVALAAPVTGSPIVHVIVVIQENRTLDNLFGSSALAVQPACSGSGLAFGPYPDPGGFIATSFTAPNGATTCLAAIPFEYNVDPNHDHQGLLAEQAQTTPPNIGFYSNAATNTVTGQLANQPGVVFGVIPAPENLLYHELAATYALADNMYSSRLVPTFPGHLFLISGQSTAADDPLNPGVTSYSGSNPVDWGCDSTAGSMVPLFTSGESESPAGQGAFPCFNYMTIGDLMDAKAVSWRYYTGSLSNTIDAGTNVYDAIQHIRMGTDWATDVSTPQTNIISDIQNCNLPNVSYVTPPGLSSDHAGSLSSSGPGWVGSIYLAIAESNAEQTNPNCQYYGNTAIIVTWDDSGGWYDHMAPPQVNGVSWGFRVPLIVASAWARHGNAGGLPYVSHTQRDFGAILRFIENNWSLGTLGEEDASADNLSDLFNYAQTPVPPIASSKVRSMISATHFNLQAASKDRTPPDDQ